jgi:gag-polyprotein putative aspartyl protease
MSVPFDPRLNLIVVDVILWGPNGAAKLRMALDTGSTSTLINAGPLVFLGYDPANSVDHAQLATGSTIEAVPCVTIDRIDALEQSRRSIRVVCHTLPVSTRIDGLLGLDFLRDHLLLLDFRKGEIALS